MLLPIQSKNPLERSPWISLIISAIFIALFALNTANGENIRLSAIQQFGLSYGHFSALQAISSLAVHRTLAALTLTLLAWWLFAGTVEGRLGHLRFALLLCLAGIASVGVSLLLHSNQPETPFFGASGLSFALIGAAIALFRSAPVEAIQFRNFGFHAVEAHTRAAAFWLITYITLNSWLGRDGSFGYLAPFVGLLLGWGFAKISGVPIDNEIYSEIRASVFDTRDYSKLHYRDLEILLLRPTTDMNLVLAFCERSLEMRTQPRLERCAETLNKYAIPLLERANPRQLSEVMLGLPASVGALPVILYLRLASRLEAAGQVGDATHILRHAYESVPQDVDSATALYRLACIERKQGRVAHARALLQDLLVRYPQCTFADEAARSLNHPT